MKYLKELCNVYWARPENIVGAARHMQVMDKIEFKGPSMDLMCGHGIYSFIMAGGDFDFDFDCYQEVVSLDQYKKGVDIQDHFSENYKPSITRKSKYQIDYGLDWKENNLKKCKTLDLYKNLVLANCNEKLPFEDSTFSTIFSNTVYWVEDIDNILKELNRIIKKDGKIYLINYLPPINDYISLYKKLDFPDEWITLVDRNRTVENKHTFSKDKWEKLFSKHGLKVTQYTPTLNQLFGHVWNIGLRPLAGYILDMSKKMKKEEYYDLKKKWANTLYDFLKPYMEKDIFSKVSNNEEIEAVFVLEKK